MNCGAKEGAMILLSYKPATPIDAESRRQISQKTP